MPANAHVRSTYVRITTTMNKHNGPQYDETTTARQAVIAARETNANGGEAIVRFDDPLVYVEFRSVPETIAVEKLIRSGWITQPRSFDRNECDMVVFR